MRPQYPTSPTQASSSVNPLVLVAARYRQRYSNGRALSYGRSHIDPSVVCVDNLPDDCQSKPRALWLGREEGVEHFFRDVGRNAWTIVGDLHENGLVHLGAILDPQPAGGDADAPGAAHRLVRVHQEVGEHLG